MPELPEVEVVKKSLENKLKNLTIKRVNISNNKLRYKINNKEFYKLKGQKFTSITRRSKYLLINLNHGYTILAHLGMTGKFVILDKKNKKQKTSFYYSIETNESKLSSFFSATGLVINLVFLLIFPITVLIYGKIFKFFGHQVVV